ncbi:hypothetical protein CPB86DRAFT_778959 [Serendipita vermifera]|nr:hypothetical protein CPB86DRAFT_778959 [Serendipita vermifera]
MTIHLKATETKVHAVTVYRVNRAEIIRIFTVDLKAGQNELDISQLPTVLDENSIRVDGAGHNAIITDVIYHPPAFDDARLKHQDAVKELQKEKKALEQQLSLYNKQAEILEKYAETLKGADTTGGKLAEFLDLYAERKGAIDIKTTEISDKIVDMDEKIKREEEVWNTHTEGRKRAVRITVIVRAEEEGTAEIYLRYVVSNASWTPLYDLRAAISSEKTDIVLHYRATVTQSTGEDWKDVELTLSTASPQLGSTVPQLYPLWLEERVARVYKASVKKAGFGFSLPRPAGLSRKKDSEADGLFVPEARVVEGTLSTSFIIEGLSTIPTDTDLTAQAHKVTVAVVDLAADLQWVSVPVSVASAFLQAKIKNTSTYIFLPGRANIFLDDNFVTKSSIDHVSPNESFHCSLGVDPQVKVTYHPRVKKLRTQGGLLSTRTTTVSNHQKITIKNTRTSTINRLLVLDQIPVSADSKINVTLLEPSQLEFAGRGTIGTSSGNLVSGTVGGAGGKLAIPPEVKISKGVSVRWKVTDDDEPEDASTEEAGAPPGFDGAREGMLEWVCEIPNGKSVDLTLVWEVSAPSRMNWAPR